MKKIFLSLAILALAVVACENNDEVTPNQEAAIDMSDFFVYTPDDVSAKNTKDANNGDKCHSMQVLNRQLQENPGLEQRMFEIEKHTRTLIANKGAVNKGRPGGGGTTPTQPYVGSISIPVIVNILESYVGKVTDAQINSQIAILNEDFNDQNPNTGGVPTIFSGLVADVQITFTVSGVNRKLSTKTAWGTRDAMKSATKGGINATDPANNLNIWVCEIGGGILGYAQFPGGALATDGIVIGSDYFGETVIGGVYGHGRTATHEVGHWLNLRHIWGDGGCGVDDYVLDTPVAGAPNYGNSDGTCQGETNSCVESTNDLPDMTMNYMDYVYDDCMYMFTKGQNDRMRTIFSEGGSRASLVN